MSYFRELPDLEYKSFLPTSNTSNDYILTKNLFRRGKLRDDLAKVFTIFNKYQIKDNSRPDLVAEELYGQADLDWVVITSAGIINIRDQWPLSDRDVYEYSNQKYGNDLLTIRYYETKEIKDDNGRLILPAGKIVDEDFEIPNPRNPLVSLNPVVSVNNYEYEVIKNDKKRLIYVLKPQYLQQYLNDMRQIMKYNKSSQYISSSLIRTQ
jgi:hypothetical protein